jgi:hypothetical protein
MVENLLSIHRDEDHSRERFSRSLANNGMFLYQHSPRCSLVLQRFLDNNPEYWCLVPMELDKANADDAALAAASSSSSTRIAITTSAFRQIEQQPESPTLAAAAQKPMLFAAVMASDTRSDQEALWLARSVPKPPSGYRFSRRQFEDQVDFFTYKKESRVQTSNLVDLYDYAIVAVGKCCCFHICMVMKTHILSSLSCSTG